MMVDEEYVRNLIQVLNTLETVTREIILLQELAARNLGPEWRELLEPLREDPEVQQQITEEMAWIVDAKYRLQESLRKLQQRDPTTPPGSPVN
ncbi:MAG: hypothetical protein WA294_00815 [Acidobacteriaceae bacterium]